MHLERPRIGFAGLVATVVLVLTACSTAGGARSGTGAVVPDPTAAVLVREPAAREPTPQPSPDAGLRSRVTRVAGDLSDVRRERVAARAHAAVERYLDAAFGRRGVPSRGFVPSLRREAGADRGVLAAGGGLEVARARAWFAVSAPHGRPVGLTARIAVDLAGDDEGPGARRAGAALTGRLLLTKVDGTWRVFGYDLARARTRADDRADGRADGREATR